MDENQRAAMAVLLDHQRKTQKIDAWSSAGIAIALSIPLAVFGLFVIEPLAGHETTATVDLSMWVAGTGLGYGGVQRLLRKRERRKIKRLEEQIETMEGIMGIDGDIEGS